MCQFRLHDECQTKPSADAGAFLDGLLPDVMRVIAERLYGRVPRQQVHVVLSTRDLHVRRFPPRPGEIDDVVVPPGGDPVESELDGARQTHDRATYALGVATTVEEQDAPPGSEQGEAAVYLDLDTITDRASALDVPLEGLLVHFVAHELSHVLREHIRPGDRTAVHGWLAERDAQQDAWNAMVDLLADPQLGQIARWGLAAQAKLSSEQPPAYRRYDATEQELRELRKASREDLIREAPLLLMRSADNLFCALRRGEMISEARVAPKARAGAVSTMEKVKPGDRVCLYDDFMTAGEWLVLRVRPEPDPSSDAGSPTPPDAIWLRLQPLGALTAGRAAKDEDDGEALEARNMPARARADQAYEEARAPLQDLLDAGHTIGNPERLAAGLNPCGER